MKITDVEVIELAAAGLPDDALDGAPVACLVRVRTDSAHTGIAEVDSTPPVIRAIVDPPRASTFWPSLKSVVLGQDPTDPPALWDRMYEATHMYGRRGVVIHAMSGIDIALWDIKGKAEGKPAAALIGTPVRNSARAYATITRLTQDPDTIRRRIDEGLKRGARGIKVCSEPEWTENPRLAETVLRVARAHIGEDTALMLDVFAAWRSADQVLPLMPLFREMKLAWLEAPLPLDDLDGFARLHGHGVPIAGGDMGLTTRFEFEPMIERGRADIVQPDATYVGGLTEMRRIAALARRHGRRLIPHGYRSNILVATNLAFLASHDADEWLEYSVANSPLRWDLTCERLPIGADGRVAVPQGPGLGVTLDEAAVARLRVS